jgi:adenylate cyclase
VADPTRPTESAAPPAERVLASVDTSPHAPGPQGIWGHIKQHKVVQWTVAYAAAAYTLLHGTEMVTAALDWPHLTVRILTLVLFLGLPVVVLLAWYHGHKAQDRVSGAELSILSVLLIIAGSILWAITRTPTSQVPTAAVGPTIPRDSIAVVPFANLTGDAAKDYFSDGMAEELINSLAQVPALKVPARTSSFAYKGRNVDIRRIAQDLGVGTILEGSVRSAGERIRVTAQLVDAKTGYHIWSQSYDRQFADIFKLQDELAAAIVQALRGNMSATVPAPGIEPPPTQDVVAYQLYLQARSVVLGEEQGIRHAIALLDQALARDPRFARALAYRAHLRIDFALFGYQLQNVLEDAERDAAQALALNPNLAEAHAALGETNASRGKWLEAETSFRAAFVGDASDPQIRAWYATFVLGSAGRMRQAHSVASEAHRLAPADRRTALQLSVVNSWMGLDADAVKFADLTIALGLPPTTLPLPLIYANAAARSARYAEAAEHAADALPAVIRSAGGAEVMKLIYFALADPTKKPAAGQVLQSLVHKLESGGSDPVTERIFMQAFTTLDALDPAYDLANQSLDEFARSGTVGVVWGPLWTPEMRPFRKDPRFQALVTRVKLIDYWEQYGPPDECDLKDHKLSCR